MKEWKKAIALGVAVVGINPRIAADVKTPQVGEGIEPHEIHLSVNKTKKDINPSAPVILAEPKPLTRTPAPVGLPKLIDGSVRPINRKEEPVKLPGQEDESVRPTR